MPKPAIVLVVLAFVLVAPLPTAHAHGVAGGDSDVQLAQTIAGTELTMVIRRTAAVPGPLQVDLIAHSPIRIDKLGLTVRSMADGRATTATVRLAAGPGRTHSALLRAERTGPHELELHAGGERSVLPFRVQVSRPALWELVSYGAFGAAGGLLIAALVCGGLASRVPAGALGGGAAAALIVGVTVALLSTQFELVRPDGAAPPGTGRPYVQAAFSTSPTEPRAGDEFTLRMVLSDGSTGRPVDDLVAHHAALVHLVVTSEDGASFQHVHPLRTAPGHLQVRLRATRPGTYFAYAEFEREDSGGQLAQGRFELRGGNRTAVVQPGLTNLPLQPVAGRPATIEWDAGSADLQAWLGMAGHLIVRSEAGDFLGHVHELGSMTAPAQNPPDDSVAAPGPILRFTFSFPEPGRYFAWVQYARDFGIVTVPLLIEVRAA